MLSILTVSLGTYGCFNMRIEFDFLKFLPDTSSLYQWYMTNKHYFPEEGFRGDIYFAENDIKTQMSRLRNLTGSFNEKSDKYLVNFDPWYQPFEKYMVDNFVDSLEDLDNIDDEKFNEKLTQFLFSPSGGRYRHLFAFEDEVSLTCGKPAPKVVVSFSIHLTNFNTYVVI